MTLAEIHLPEGCLVVSVVRDERETVPNGQTKLMEGDRLVVLCNEYMVAEIEDTLEEMCKTVTKL